MPNNSSRPRVVSMPILTYHTSRSPFRFSLTFHARNEHAKPKAIHSCNLPTIRTTSSYDILLMTQSSTVQLLQKNIFHIPKEQNTHKTSICASGYGKPATDVHSSGTETRDASKPTARASSLTANGLGDQLPDVPMGVAVYHVPCPTRHPSTKTSLSWAGLILSSIETRPCGALLRM